MWADPITMADLGPAKDAAASDATIARHRLYHDTCGLGFNTVLSHDGTVLGLCGLKPGAPDTPIEHKTEIGWILARTAWGQGFAREAAAATLDWAWHNLAIESISAITGRNNASSRRLMERIGMTHIEDADFWHPNYTSTDARGDTVIYEIARSA